MYLFFNNPATPKNSPLPLHDALPIYLARRVLVVGVADTPGAGLAAATAVAVAVLRRRAVTGRGVDRKSTRLNSSHANISYAVFCLKKTFCFTGACWTDLGRRHA